MRYLRLFENYSSLEYPDVFGDSLLRGVKIEKDEYIDDPKLRKVSIGSSDNEDYVYFLNNYKNLGLQDPTKSVHFYLNPTQEQKSMIGYYGKSFKPIPEKNAKFSFNKELRNGGLGSTWWFPERVLGDFTNLSKDLIKKYSNSFGHSELYYENIDEFNRLMNEYQQILIDNGVVGNLTYDELLGLTGKSEPMQIWTESSVLHKAYPPKPDKQPTPYKNKPILTKQDFIDLDIDLELIGDFYKEYSDIFKRFQNVLDSNPDRYSLIRQEALDMVKKWNNNNNI